MLKIRRPLGRLIFNMGIAIPGKTVFRIETAPWFVYSTSLMPLGYMCRITVVDASTSLAYQATMIYVLWVCVMKRKYYYKIFLGLKLLHLAQNKENGMIFHFGPVLVQRTFIHKLAFLVDMVTCHTPLSFMLTSWILCDSLINVVSVPLHAVVLAIFNAQRITFLLVQIMVYRMFGAKPSPVTILTYRYLYL